jgi:GT2 family glycosyltransferase
MISHQGSFIKKSVFDDVGTFSKEFTIRMDYEFWLRALKKYDFYFIDEVMVDYLAGISSNNIKRYYQEEILANRKHHVSWYFSMKACLKYIIKKYILMYG